MKKLIFLNLVILSTFFINFDYTPVKAEVVNATDYGAVCDGVTDDTAAIQSALDSAEIVLLPHGVCIISGTSGDASLTVNDGNVLKGEGPGNTTLKKAANNSIHAIGVYSVTGVEIRDLSIEGDTTTGGHGIRGVDVQQLTIDNVWISGTSYGIGFQSGTFQDIRFNDLRISDTLLDGIDFKNDNSDNQAIFMSNITVFNAGNNAGKSSGIDIRGIAHLNNIFVYDIPTGKTGIRFREAGPTTGGGAEYSTLSNFTIKDDDAEYGIHMPAQRVTVSNGVVKGTMSIGFWVSGGLSSISNVITDEPEIGIILDTAAKHVTINNFIARTGSKGFVLKADYGILTGSIGNNQSTTGIEITSDSDGFVVTGNMFRSNGGGTINNGTNVVSGNNYGF